MTHALRIPCPHCGGTRRMHETAPHGVCIYCDDDGRMAEDCALRFAAISRVIAREGVCDGDISPDRARAMVRQADEIEAFFAGAGGP